MPALWHALAIDATLADVRSREDGLTDAEAAARLAEFGPNRLPAPPRVTVLDVLIDQLNSVVVYLLVAAILVSLFFRDSLEAIAIAAVLVINTVIGFTTEYRSRRAMETLISLEVPRASVLRNGRLRVISTADLVPGDVFEIDAGRQVPADARLLESADLSVDEAPLTGESLPVSKTHADVLPADMPLADRRNMLYMGTTVASGLGRAVITATGPATEIGRIGRLVNTIAVERTPLERRLDALGRRLVWMTLAVAGVVGVLGLLEHLAVHDAIETAISLAVAAVPEALPAVATIALAVGMARMAKRHSLVRRLPAVEALGSTTVVCTDKTRTLTSGEMAVVHIAAGGVDARYATDEPDADTPPAVRRLLETAALASRDQPDAGANGEPTRVDPVDRAMLAAAARAGIRRTDLETAWPEAGLLPFSSERKLMASFQYSGSDLLACVKGAPTAVLALCAQVATGDGDRPLDAAALDAQTRINEQLAGQGLRVLAVARGPVSATQASALSGLTFLGLVGLADPPAPGVRQTIQQLRRAGLRTIMLTGDQRLTAESVGRDLGVIEPGSSAIDGRELDRLSAAEVRDAVGRHAVFSRITPEHKLVVVQALKARGEIVAMLGDGVNDAAALKQADVGVAMGIRGTDVAKQASSIVLQDDRFETVAAAVEEGRVIYDNIRKFVFYLFSCNVAEVLVLLITSLLAWPLPLVPLQLLWVNLVTDTFPALALSLEPGSADVMTRPPRPPDEEMLSRAFFIRVFMYAGVLTAVILAAYIWGLTYAPDRARTMAFMTMVLAEIAQLGNVRQRGPVLALRAAISNPFAVGGALLSLGLQVIACLVPPLARLLHLVALDAEQWTIVIGLAVAPAIVMQVAKTIRSRWERPSAADAAAGPAS